MQCGTCGKEFSTSPESDCCPLCLQPPASVTLWMEYIDETDSAAESIRLRSPMRSDGTGDHLREKRIGEREDPAADYSLNDTLGQGGMGTVYRADQHAFGRSVAVKMIHPDRAFSDEAAEALRSEAVVTGRLEHPNIVPVYDLGLDEEGRLFYAMKEVDGVPWSAVMREKSEAENLDILLRVADAVSYAHARGVLHRDLKPCNVMLGPFGEVMVMDWGAAFLLSKDSGRSAYESGSRLCGTPVYMPPEMAKVDMRRISPASDVYLLGAILYEIETGHPPRRERDAVFCMALASENHIEPVEHETALLRIALKAMASAPADRYPDVASFQQALRDYRSTTESRHVMALATENLRKAQASGDYDTFNLSLFGFRQAVELWPDNHHAKIMQDEVLLAYAECAFRRSDYELAESLLDRSVRRHRELLDRIEQALRERDQHRRRMKRLLLTARLFGLALLVVFAVGFVLVTRAHHRMEARHRGELINLISAHFGEQNHEAAVATFWQLHAEYGIEGLSDETLLQVRVAAAMNPWRGMVDSGVERPLDLIPSVRSNCVWVVAPRKLVRVRIDPHAGYADDSILAIHDFHFGRRRPIGQTVETIPLPFAVESGHTLHEAHDGTLWLGHDSALYRYVDGAWKLQLDVSNIPCPPLPEAYNIDRAAVETWMAEEGRRQPVTGLLLDRAQDHAAVALGNAVVGWYNLRSGTCEGWLAVGSGTRFGERLAGGRGERTLLALSADESRLLFRPTGQGASLAFWFRLPDMMREGYVYNRDYALRSMAATQDGRFWLVGENGLLLSPTPDFFQSFDLFYKGGDEGNEVRWGPENCDLTRLGYSNIRHAAFSQQDGSCCVVTQDGRLFYSSAGIPRFEVERQIVKRDVVDQVMLSERHVVILSADGHLHGYDAAAYAFAEQQLAGYVRTIGTGLPPHQLYGMLSRRRSQQAVSRLTFRAGAAPQVDTLLEQGCDALALDPTGRCLALIREGRLHVYDQATLEEVYESVVVETREPSDTFKLLFDTEGRWLLSAGSWRGNWIRGFRLLRTDTWEEIPLPEEVSDFPQFSDACFEQIDGRLQVVLSQPSTKTLFALQETDHGTLELYWKTELQTSPLSLMPCRDPATGRRAYWCKGWFQGFDCIDAETGRVIKTQDHWIRSGIEQYHLNPDQDRVVLVGGNGTLNMSLASDLYPVFDRRMIRKPIEKAFFSRDGSRLLMTSDGRLHIMQLPPLERARPD